MAAGTVGGETPTLFLRNATGLVRGWSVRDSMIYACLATNFVTLAIYELSLIHICIWARGRRRSWAR